MATHCCGFGLGGPEVTVIASCTAMLSSSSAEPLSGFSAVTLSSLPARPMSQQTVMLYSSAVSPFI